jgi:hypothetical protein
MTHPSLPRLKHSLSALMIGIAFLAMAGCQSPPLTVTVPHIERLRVLNPDTKPLDIDRALSDRADAFAKQRPDTKTWRGKGLSMQPLIPPDAWIVTETIPFETLERGQVVLFTSRHGRRVAHALVKNTREGWITVGVNNKQVADRSRVTRQNYIGVVTAAFATDRSLVLR